MLPEAVYGSSGVVLESVLFKVARVDPAFYLVRGKSNTASCVRKNEIYAFESDNYKEAHRYSLVSGKWILFYSE